ncbi:MAG: ABC transporter ATP-binding protein [bacterium]|nr:ABC transporter ATP-binding protein [bacterium]MCP4799542.1 ABC transporter ATP-binding protein [bacterium]
MLNFKNISFSYGSNLAVDQLSLQVNPGEIYGLLGPNGAGKSTSVMLAIGFLTPDNGVVEINGQSPAKPEVRQQLGVAPQSLSIYEELTALGNLQFFGKMYGLSGNKLSERVEWALEFVSLSDRCKDTAASFSGGMKRRLNLAAALLHDPDMLLLDEPTAGVDPQSRNSLFENIEELKRQGKTIIYTTHYMEEAERLCDRVGIIDKGKLLAQGTIQELVKEHGAEDRVFATVGNTEQELTSENHIAELAQLQSDGQLEHFRTERANLEQVFLNLTGRKLRD